MIKCWVYFTNQQVCFGKYWSILFRDHFKVCNVFMLKIVYLKAMFMSMLSFQNRNVIAIESCLKRKPWCSTYRVLDGQCAQSGV